MTSHLTSTSRGYRLLDATTDWVLDRHGDLCWDEQERLRRYEGLAVAATVQSVLIPWLAVVALALWGRPVAPAIILVLVGIYLPGALATSYVTRWRARTVPDRRSRKRSILHAAAAAPNLIALFQILVAYHASRASIYFGIVGAATGMVIDFFALRGRRLREQARDLSPDDLG
jgi:hypothetical protein